ncbi:hypothetical protein AOQ84DRAFT_120411 [Glonium stellatum]|uniref:Uncharacterized protein n=1 Tax=Glonium stellatum TaxID=574774 RepID=A0A8E2JXY0_9PEZI|nr:hypothetical protein AOQ84DRAFT_120411 [Glonium stellatum]
MAATQCRQSTPAMEYRRSEHTNGNVVRVQESRRHTQPSAASGLSSSARRPAASTSVVPSIQSREGWRMPSNAVLVPNFKDRPAAAAAEVHVTRLVGKTRNLRRKPAVIQNFSDAFPKGESALFSNKSFRQHDLPSPPPTPRFQRLATPDLPQLEEARFCDCCADSRAVKFCSSCGCSLEQGLL